MVKPQEAAKKSASKACGGPPVTFPRSRHGRGFKPDNRARVNKKLELRQAEFLDRYSVSGSILEASEATGISRDTHYRWLAGDPTYRERFELAKDRAVDALEARVFSRANTDSDRLAEFLLKGLRPQIYGNRFASTKVEVNLPSPQHVPVTLEELLRSATVPLIEYDE